MPTVDGSRSYPLPRRPWTSNSPLAEWVVAQLRRTLSTTGAGRLLRARAVSWSWPRRLERGRPEIGSLIRYPPQCREPGVIDRGAMMERFTAGTAERPWPTPTRSAGSADPRRSRQPRCGCARTWPASGPDTPSSTEARRHHRRSAGTLARPLDAAGLPDFIIDPTSVGGAQPAVTAGQQAVGAVAAQVDEAAAAGRIAAVTAAAATVRSRSWAVGWRGAVRACAP
jgi:hypothetical protein